MLVGLGTGSMAMSPLAATVVGRWFTARRGLVTGVLAAAASAGQLVFLPLVATLARDHGWRTPCLVIAAVAAAVVPLVLLRLHEHPADRGVEPYGGALLEAGPVRPLGALGALRLAVRHRAFWFLAAGFAVCGATTNGLVGTHFVAAAHDHGMPPTTAASLLALVGLFDVAGTIASGWLTDRVDPRWLLLGYYALRGVSLLLLPGLLARTCSRRRGCFVVFYGLDWIATVPPTIALARQHFGSPGRWCSGGCSPRTRWAPPSWPSSPGSCATAPAPTTARSGSAASCASALRCCRCRWQGRERPVLAAAGPQHSSTAFRR